MTPDDDLPAGPFGPEHLKRVYRDVATLARDFVVKTLAPLESRLAALERRAQEPKGLAYQGVWQRAATHQRNQGVTHSGVIRVALADDVRTEPKPGAKEWELAEKAPEDRRR
jgi:hypothetical protein